MEGGGGGNSSCLMSFGDHHGGGNSGGGGGLASMMMMQPPHQNNNNNLFLPLPSTTNHHSNQSNTARYFSDQQQQQQNDGSNNNSIRAKIMAHPHYPRLLAAYGNCQKVGAPPEVVARLEEACASEVSMGGRGGTGSLGEDPALDQFMEAYCEMLTKYEQELTKPFKEAMLFLSRIECQFKALTVGSSDSGDD